MLSSSSESPWRSAARAETLLGPATKISEAFGARHWLDTSKHSPNPGDHPEREHL